MKMFMPLFGTLLTAAQGCGGAAEGPECVVCSPAGRVMCVGGVESATGGQLVCDDGTGRLCLAPDEPCAQGG